MGSTFSGGRNAPALASFAPPNIEIERGIFWLRGGKRPR
jgi:hypothetical protein